MLQTTLDLLTAERLQPVAKYILTDTVLAGAPFTEFDIAAATGEAAAVLLSFLIVNRTQAVSPITDPQPDIDVALSSGAAASAMIPCYAGRGAVELNFSANEAVTKVYYRALALPAEFTIIAEYQQYP